jgi:hypothetical protein
MSPEEVIWNAVRGALVTRALGLATDLGVPQALRQGPVAVAELAAASGADPDTLQRVLRALASDGIFEETTPGTFRNTDASALLASSGWGEFAHLFAGEWMQATAALDLSGQPAFPRVHGDEFWSWLQAHPDERAIFDRAMAQGWERRLAHLESVDWDDDELVVDVGGGNGALLRALIDQHPQMRGIVFDLPETDRDEQQFGERCRFIAGSFFETVPSGDAHLLTGILHDWDDASAARILTTIRASAGKRLIVLDSIIEAGNAPDGAKWLDLLMLIHAGGRERTENEWRTLLQSTGWAPVTIGPDLIEAHPA